jgi:hypothetical protein
MQDSSKPIWLNKIEENKTTNKEISILVCTPVHNECSIHYTQALLEFQLACVKRNILVSFLLLKSSLVTQGRNLCVSSFLNEKHIYSHLLFIDSDIDFTPESIFNMLEYDKEVISIPYPMKTLDWERIYKFRNEIKNSKELSNMGYTYPIKVKDNSNIIVKKDLMEVTHAPAGCMLIKRQVFYKLIEAYPHLKISQPTILNGEASEKENLWNFFDTYHDLETKKYYGEDFGFCKKWTDIGGECYCYIGKYITHVGEYQYSGCFKNELIHSKKPDTI